MPPRIAPADPAGPSAAPESRRRPVYLPRVTPGQRAILDFLQEDLHSGWPLALNLLAKYSSVAARGGDRGGGLAIPESVVVDGRGLESARGADERVGVTVECTVEAAGALSTLMAGRVPRKDRALALEGLLQEVCWSGGWGGWGG